MGLGFELTSYKFAARLGSYPFVAIARNTNIGYHHRYLGGLRYQQPTKKRVSGPIFWVLGPLGIWDRRGNSAAVSPIHPTP